MILLSVFCATMIPPSEVATGPSALFPRPFQIYLGTAEVLAAIGLTLPGITRILPWLVPSAAAD